MWGIPLSSPCCLPPGPPPGAVSCVGACLLFNSLTFIVFVVWVLAVHYAPGLPWKFKKGHLLLASYLFYAAWNPPFVILLWLSTVLDWKVAQGLDRTDAPGKRRALLAVSLVGNLGLLAYYKYGQFVLDNFVTLADAAGIAYQPLARDIILPVGISFYTFQTLSYSLDVYLRRARPATSFLDFALFVTFFPQLVAGPIVRPTDLVPQFAQPARATGRQFGWGLFLMTLGLFEKVVLADGILGKVSDAVFGASTRVAPLDAWTGVIAFSGQILCDFAGYTTTAIGVSLAMGFSLIDNFRFPYAAIGFSDFWRRWHISLSSWLRDYLYIPLGGNRRGPSRTYVNLMLTMLLGGLWHGAAWTFVVWGGLHGAYLCAERWLQPRAAGMPFWKTSAGRVSLAVLTYALVNLTWVFFRARSFGDAGRLLSSMLFLDASGAPLLNSYLLLSGLGTMLVLLLVQWFLRDDELHTAAVRVPMPVFGAAWGVMLFLLAITNGGSDAFIYFQF